MKKLIALMAIASVAFVSCSKDDNNEASNNNNGGGGGGAPTLTVDRIIRPLFVDYTATWCGPCGSSGGPAFDGTITQEGTLLCPMKVYSTSSNPGMGHPLYTSMTSAFGVTGIPDFWVNNTAVSTSTNSVLSNATTIQNDTTKLTAGVALSKSVDGDTMTIITKSQFFKSQSTGDYYLAVYVVEDNVIGGQLVGSTQNPSYDHRNILRASAKTTYYGETLNANTAIAADQVFDKTYKIYLNPAWNKNKLKVIATIWKKATSGPYTAVNSNMVK